MFKVRFLLTRKCSARCAYCHNEGQSSAGRSLLRVSQIERILNKLDKANRLPDEIILSGGEPTLNKNVTEIARLCKSTGSRLSMDSHGGHPDQLEPALPYLDELKLHIDSFVPEEQQASMGIAINAVQESIERAQKHANLLLIANHPLVHIEKTKDFIVQARSIGIHVKIINLLNSYLSSISHWRELGYFRTSMKSWLHKNGQHQLFTKRCEGEHNSDLCLFIDTEGVRYSIDTPSLCPTEEFDAERLIPKEPIERMSQPGSGAPRSVWGETSVLAPVAA